VIDSVTYGSSAWRSELDEGHSLARIPPALRPPAPQPAWRASLDPLGELPGSLPQSFGDWQTRHFPSYLANLETISLPDADPDADGLDNWMEYALGTTPRQANALPMDVLTTPQGQYLRLERRPGLADVNMQALSSSDVAAWQLLAQLPPGGQPTAGGRESVSVLLPATSTRQFYRIEITD
jgi:hypothetical protein